MNCVCEHDPSLRVYMAGMQDMLPVKAASSTATVDQPDGCTLFERQQRTTSMGGSSTATGAVSQHWDWHGVDNPDAGSDDGSGNGTGSLSGTPSSAFMLVVQ